MVISFVPSFIHSFVRLFVLSFVRSFIHSFIHSFVRLFVLSPVRSFSSQPAHPLPPPVHHTTRSSASFFQLILSSPFLKTIQWLLNPSSPSSCQFLTPYFLQQPVSEISSYTSSNSLTSLTFILRSEAYQGRARFQQHRDASCHQVFFSRTRQGAERNSRHSDRNIRPFPSWSGYELISTPVYRVFLSPFTVCIASSFHTQFDCLI